MYEVSRKSLCFLVFCGLALLLGRADTAHAQYGPGWTVYNQIQSQYMDGGTLKTDVVFYGWVAYGYSAPVRLVVDCKGVRQAYADLRPAVYDFPPYGYYWTISRQRGQARSLIGDCTPTSRPGAAKQDVQVNVYVQNSSTKELVRLPGEQQFQF